MIYEVADFNGAEKLFQGALGDRWHELERVLSSLTPHIQASDQAGKRGVPIWDPKGTNAALTTEAATQGWRKVPVPSGLSEFGQDWDAGKGTVLAEWQFSNYPFLWNNIIRSEAIYHAATEQLPQLTGAVQALIIVTKSGSFPASNSTLYYEQARAQVAIVTKLSVFTIPIRVVGLMLPKEARHLDCKWSQYSGRYSRQPTTSDARLNVEWRGLGKYGQRIAILTRES